MAITRVCVLIGWLPGPSDPEMVAALPGPPPHSLSAAYVRRSCGDDSRAGRPSLGHDGEVPAMRVLRRRSPLPLVGDTLSSVS